MRAFYASLLISAASLAALNQVPALAQTEGSTPPFTLAISVNLHNPSQDEPGDKTVDVRSGVSVRIRKTNITDQEIPKPGPENGPFGCLFDIRDGGGNPTPPRKRSSGSLVGGGGPAPILGTKDTVLQPGESISYFAPVSEWYDLSKPGIYTIQVSQHVSSDPNSAVVKSNKVTVTVTP